MNKLDRAAVAVGILVSVEGLYDRYVTRRRNRELELRDQQIKDLQDRLAKLEKKEKA